MASEVSPAREGQHRDDFEEAAKILVDLHRTTRQHDQAKSTTSHPLSASSSTDNGAGRTLETDEVPASGLITTGSTPKRLSSPTSPLVPNPPAYSGFDTRHPLSCSSLSPPPPFSPLKAITTATILLEHVVEKDEGRPVEMVDSGERTELVERFMESFSKFHWDLEPLDKTFPVFDSLIQEFGFPIVAPLGITVEFHPQMRGGRMGSGSTGMRKGGALTSTGGSESGVKEGGDSTRDGGEKKSEEVDDRTRFYVYQCGSCLVQDEDFTRPCVFKAPFPFRSIDDFKECFEHLRSPDHQRKAMNMQLGLGGSSKVSKRKIDSVDDQEAERASKRIASGTGPEGFSATTPDLLPDARDGDSFLDPTASSSVPSHPDITSTHLFRRVANTFDLTLADSATNGLVESLNDLLLANNGNAAVGNDDEEDYVGPYEGPPNMALLPFPGPISDVEQALSVLKLPNVDTPLDDMRYTLTREQLTAVASIWYMADNPFEETKGFMLCDAVGMGKTCSALSVFVKDRRETGGRVRSTAIICPAGIQTAVWKSEINKHAPWLQSSVAHIQNARDWVDYIGTKSGRPPVIIIPYELLQNSGGTEECWETAPVRISDFQAYRIIADEFQHARRTKTRLAKVLMSYAERNHVKHVLLLSATPTPTDVCELYLPLRMINRLKNNEAKGTWGKAKRRNRDQAELLSRELRHPFYMSREFDYAEYLNSIGLSKQSKHLTAKPSGYEEQIFRKLRTRLIQLYKDHMCNGKSSVRPQDLIAQDSPILGILEGMRILSLSFEGFIEWYEANKAILELNDEIQTIASRVRGHYTAKIIAVGQEILQISKSDNAAKILVVGQDEFFQGALQAFLESRGISRDAMLCLDWNFPDRRAKENALHRFATDSYVPIMMGALTPLSEGKNLQMCNFLYILDTPRSTAALVQMTGRLVRHGQTRNVVIAHCVTRMGPDEMYETLVYHRGMPLGDYRLPMITYQQLGQLMKLPINKTNKTR